MEEKIHTKAVVDVSRAAIGRIFLGEIREGVNYEPIISCKAVPKNLNLKFRSKFNHGFTNRGLHCGILKAYNARDM